MTIEFSYNIGIKQNMGFGSAKGKMSVGCPMGYATPVERNDTKHILFLN
jgi:hypothetical protein